ncbi:MAG: glycosyltransferase [Deltaproteobacteria bacterium]|nr:glycosyltransferase [Deltaproteobacteria bacterium]
MPKKKGKNKKKKLSIILPAYNEADNIEKTIESFVAIQHRINFDVTLIVVNDGSTDATPDICQVVSREYPFVKCINHAENIGYGGAIISGIKAAEGEYVAICDSDCQFDAADLLALLKFTRSFDVIVGYRENRADPLGRRVLGRIWTMISRFLFDIKIRDLNCALKVFRLPLVKDLDLRCVGPGINMEILAHLSASEIPIKEVPCIHYPRTAGRQTGSSPRVIKRAFAELMSLLTRKDSTGSSLMNRGPAAVIFLLVLAFFLRVPNFTESLWYDEIWYTSSFLNARTISHILFNDVHPPLYPLIIFGWINVFGDSEMAVRTPSLLFGLCSLWVLYLLARFWFNRSAAILAVSLAALSPVHIWYSQENKNNMLLMLLTLVSVYSLQKAWNDDRWRPWIVFIIVSVLSLYTNIFAVWIILSLFIWMWARVFFGPGRRRFKIVLISSISVALSYLPFIVSTLLQMDKMGRGYLRAFSLEEFYRLFLIYLSHGNTVRTLSPYFDLSKILDQPWFYFLVDGLFAALVLWGLIGIGLRIWKRRPMPFERGESLRTGSGVFLCYLFIPPSLLFIASFFYKHIFIERSMIIMLPPFLILLAYSVLSIPRSVLRNIALALLLTINVWALYNLWWAKSETWTVYKQNPDWRSATHYFYDLLKKPSGRFVIAQITPTDSLSYYYSRIRKTDSEKKVDLYPSKLPGVYIETYKREELERLIDQNGLNEIYLIHNLYWSGPFEKIYNDFKKERVFREGGKVSYKGLEIHKFIVSD